MATTKSTTAHVTAECKALLSSFETFLYTHCKVNVRTASLYLGVLRRAHPLIGSNPSHADLESFIMLMRADGKSSPGYVSIMVSTIERFSEYLGNPIHMTRPKKRINGVPVTLTEAEVAIMLHATKSIREKAIVATLAYSGIRNNEFCSLRIRDLDIPNGVIRLEECKFDKQRTIPVTGECLGVLEQYLAWRRAQLEAKGKVLFPDDFLFVTKRNGLQLEAQDVRKIIHVLAKRAKIDRRVWPHLLRHSLATNMVNRNAHLLTIKDQLGHVYVQSTMIYVHRSKNAHCNDYRQHAPSYL